MGSPAVAGVDREVTLNLLIKVQAQVLVCPIETARAMQVFSDPTNAFLQLICKQVQTETFSVLGLLATRVSPINVAPISHRLTFA